MKKRKKVKMKSEKVEEVGKRREARGRGDSASQPRLPFLLGRQGGDGD